MEKLQKLILILFIMIKTFKKIIPLPIYRFLLKIYLYLRFVSDFCKFTKINDFRFSVSWKDRYPQLFDNIKETPFENHYTYHPAWASRIVSKITPKVHIDISSTLNFCTIVSAFVPVNFYDYRQANLNLSNLKTEYADLLNLPFADNSIESISCMHTIEHIGLGRYGDPIDPKGDLKAIDELKRVLAPGGSLIFVVPVGYPKIQYNAHRIYSYKMVINYFKELKLEEFSLIKESGDEGVIKNATEKMADNEHYGCGCFWFKK